MLRAIIRRNMRDNHSGMESEVFETLEFECPELENSLRLGGFGPTGYDVAHLVGIELFEKGE